MGGEGGGGVVLSASGPIRKAGGGGEGMLSASGGRGGGGGGGGGALQPPKSPLSGSTNPAHKYRTQSDTRHVHIIPISYMLLIIHHRHELCMCWAHLWFASSGYTANKVCTRYDMIMNMIIS